MSRSITCRWRQRRFRYQGGYPEQILSPHPTYLTDLLDAVINKDIVRGHGIKNPDILSKLLLLLAQRLGQRTSHSKLKNILRVSQDVVRNYLSHLMEVYLIGEVAKFSYSVLEISVLNWYRCGNCS